MLLAIGILIVVFVVIIVGAKFVDKNWHTYGDTLGNDKDNTDKLYKLDEL